MGVDITCKISECMQTDRLLTIVKDLSRLEKASKMVSTGFTYVLKATLEKLLLH